MSFTEDPYEILQVSKAAEPEVIEAAYRRLARKYHPDVNPNETTQSRMQKINWAYEILGDPEKKARYDRAQWSKQSNSNTGDSSQAHYGTGYYSKSSYVQRNRTKSKSPKGVPKDSYSINLVPKTYYSVFIGSIILAVFYGCSFLFVVFPSSGIPIFGWLVAIGSFGISALLSIAAAAGWNSRKIQIWRVILMLLLTIYPITSWITCYFAGKAIARRTSKHLVSRSSSLPLVIYGISAIFISLLLSEGLSLPSLNTAEMTTYVEFRDPEISVKFEHPGFFSPQSETITDRMPAGTIITLTEISAASTNPASIMLIRIIDDPVREEMFPNLYPPDNPAVLSLARMDIYSLQFDDEQITQEAILQAADEAEIIAIAGFPGVEYSLLPKNTSIGDAVVKGAYIVTDNWDVSLFFMVSIETDVSGSLTMDEVDGIWEHILETLVLE